MRVKAGNRTYKEIGNGFSITKWASTKEKKKLSNKYVWETAMSIVFWNGEKQISWAIWLVSLITTRNIFHVHLISFWHWWKINLELIKEISWRPHLSEVRHLYLWKVLMKERQMQIIGHWRNLKFYWWFPWWLDRGIRGNLGIPVMTIRSYWNFLYIISDTFLFKNGFLERRCVLLIWTFWK